jgi:CubicO group peptidase (beta-lactamase class C family)
MTGMSTRQAQLAAIDAFVAAQMELGRAPGIGLATYHDGQLVHERGYGFADVARGIPMTERTPVVIGSTTKGVTAAALLQLVEAGQVRLEEPVRTYLPSFRLADEDAASRIAVWHLLTHTAGLPPTPRDAPNFVPPRGDQESQEYIDELATVAPVWPPGAGWLYANDGYTLAGRIIEVVSGTPYAEYVSRRIFAPLGLEGARFAPTREPDPDVATPYDYDGVGEPFPSYFPFDRTYAAGFALMGAHDAARWLQVMLDGGRLDGQRILTPESVAAMMRQQVDARTPGQGTTIRRGYGFGWGVGEVNDIPTVSHGGSAITMGSQFLIAPRERLAVAVVANSGTAVTSIIAEGVLSLLCGTQPARSFPMVDRSYRLDRTRATRIAGTYQATVPQSTIPGPMAIEYNGETLRSRTYPGGSRHRPGDIVLVPVDDTTFVLYGRGATGAVAAFEIAGSEIRGTFQDVPLVKIADQVHQGRITRWPAARSA